MDLSTLSVPQLRDLQQRIPAELKKREAREKAEALNKLREMAKTLGYTLDELLAKEAAVKTPGAKVAVKYRHPENPTLEWTGRGRKPKWVESWLANGGALDNLLV